MRYFALATVMLVGILAFATLPKVIDQFSGKVIGISYRRRKMRNDS